MGLFGTGDKVKIREGKLRNQTGTIVEEVYYGAAQPSYVIGIKAASSGTVILHESSLELYDEDAGKITKTNKFEIGNKVKIIRGGFPYTDCFKGFEGFIVGVEDFNDRGYGIYCDDLYERYYLVKIKGNQVVSIEENNLVRDTSPIGLFEERRHAGGYKDVAGPAFRIGDVVNVAAFDGNQNRICVVREVAMMELYEAVKYVYHVSPVDSGDEVYTYDADSLEYQYHDAAWRQYLDESMQNRLPEWKGEPYSCCSMSKMLGMDYGDLELACKYNNDTIPPAYMDRILKEHGIYDKINFVLGFREKREAMEKKLHIKRPDNFAISLEEKINSEAEHKFTKLEMSFVSELDNLYVPDDGGMDHFPIEMTDFQIMQAVREAYNTACRISEIKLQRVRDRRMEISYQGYYWDEGDIIEPAKGRALYEGKSKNGLVIRFWYNFDLDLIEDAYPVRMNNNCKKH